MVERKIACHRHRTDQREGVAVYVSEGWKGERRVVCNISANKNDILPMLFCANSHQKNIICVILKLLCYT